MVTRAVVLGGGGPVGIAWESGIAAGLAEHGINIGEADFIMGTSAGSVVGSQLALGRSPQSLLAAQLALPAATGLPPGSGTPASAPDLTPLMELMARAATSTDPPEQVRAEIGAFALAAKTMSEEEWLASFGRIADFGAEGWPGHSYTCTAVDAETGEFVTWGQGSGVPLGRAVASSCAVPGIFPPITLNGRRYIDGGMRSATNADVAKGHDRVLAVAVTVGLAPPGVPDRSRMSLDDEVGALREGGAAVETIVPDRESLEVFGVNLMDGSRRAACAEAGLRQGRAEGQRLKAFWGSP